MTEEELYKKAWNYENKQLPPENECDEMYSPKQLRAAYITGYHDAVTDECNNLAEVGTWKKDELTKLIKKRLNDNPKEMKNPYYAIGVCNAIFFIITGEDINIPVEY